MPGHCCVPGCRGNYDGEKTVRVFTFPADADRRRRWLKAIPRADFEPGKRSVVCERHFRESDILTSSKYVDSKTGKVVEAKLKIARLSSDAVPSVFPNCPAYLSAPAATSREAPAEKRMRLEAASLREAIANSLETHEEEETKHKFDTFQALLECLPQMKLSNFWSVISRPACIHFLNLALEDAPRVLLSITVLEDLTVKVHCQDVQLTTIDGIGAIPHKVNDIRCLTRLLDSVESLHGELSCKHEDKIEGLLKLAFSLLEDASNCELADVERLNAIRFLKEQVSLLLVRHSKQSRYSPEFLVLSSILFTISPHAYRFLRSTGNVRLPHPSTIRRVCNSYNVSPEAEQQGASFLSYAKKLVTTMKEHEKIVVLMMDEIHLQPYFDYKGGTIVGAASNSPNAAKTAHVFMMQSLLSSQKNVVHILPVERINAEELHTLLRSIITQLENVGLRIIAVITDNNSINRKTMSLFGAPCKLQSVYVAGYCAHAAFKKLLCMACKESLMLDDDIEVEGGELIKSMTRGGLKFPQPAIINAVVTAEIVLDKLRSEQHAQQFHALPNQKEALLALTHDAINNNVDFDVCENGHSPQLVMHYVLSAAANTLLNNLCKRKNDQLVVEKAARDKERKLKTLKK
ncbi:uncharacterized protein LOC119170405 [Rhipicephalus microplus]|uniref:uncharacterized protein LOC119170405 n=1 Tax=Rhipicephalus microplus TaxID=6941 RepID=UPI003F6CB69D